MKFCVISVSKTKDQAILSLEAEYRKRLKGLEILELSAATLRKCSNEEAEGEVILKMAGSYDKIISLDENGKQFNSVDFSKLLKKWIDTGSSSFAFIVGGAYGLSNKVKTESDFVLSLSSMTFPFQLARLLTVEQIYRASCIINGHPYHKI